MKRIHILVSTTRGWNPGDEFIWFGIQNLLRNLEMSTSNIVFNRAYGLSLYRITLTKWCKHILQKLLYSKYCRNVMQEFFSIFFEGRDLLCNGYKQYLEDELGQLIDHIVFAGTPEVFSWRNKIVLAFALKYNIPVHLVGVQLLDDVPQNPYGVDMVRTVIVRDKKSLQLARKIFYNGPIICLPCPSLFCWNTERIVEEVNTIGIVYSTNESVPCNRIRDGERFRKLLRKVILKYGTRKQVYILTHYVDELCSLHKWLRRDSTINALVDATFFSSDARDYESAYREIDVLVSARVHGTFSAASLGVPSVYIGHDTRASTVELLPVPRLSLYTSDLWNKVEKSLSKIISNPREISSSLLSLKEESKRAYMSVLREAFDKKSFFERKNN